MKKFTATLLLLFMTLTASADRFEVDGIIYESKNDTEVWISSFDKGNLPEGSITIPATVTNSGMTYSVTAIGDNAFNCCDKLTSIEIPNSVTEIGHSAFYGCSSLTSVTIPNSVTSIGDGAFYCCSSLTSVTIPNSVTFIGYYAFNACSALTSITIPNSVTSIGGLAFVECRGLTSIVVESGNSVYDSRENCNAIIKTKTNTLIRGCNNSIIPNSVTSIGFQAFYGCSGLTSITIPNSVTSIEHNAFNGCSALTSITIPNSVTSIGDYAFYGCSGLDTVTSLAATAPTLGDEAFIGIPATAVLRYPAGSDYSAWEQYFATTIEISNNIAEGTCGDSLIWVLTSDSTLTISGTGTMTGYNSSDNKAPWYDVRESIKNVIINDGITTIGEVAFADCYSLTSITIPNSVTSIGDDAFYNCSGLTSITIPNSVTSIGYWAFYNCSGLTSITIPNSVTSIGEWAFGYCFGLTSITIPNSVTSIGEWAFYWCSSLTSIVVESGNSVYDSRENCNAIIETKTNTLIQGCKNSIIPNSVTSIGNSAFTGCSALTSITIPNSVTSIESSAFTGCSALTSIVVESGNSVYDSRENCNAIIETKTNTLIQGCNNSIIPNSVTSIGGWAFTGCTGLTSITIPNSVTSIESSAFAYCSGLTSITIPNSVTSIGNSAFWYCSGLTSITIPNSVTSIGDYAFWDCSRLTNIYSYIPADNLFAVDAFYKDNCTLYVPAGAKATYAATDGWSEFTNIVEMEPDVTIEAENISTAPGRSITLPVAMSNSEAITAFQMDLTLPEEVNFTSVTLGNDRTTESHTIQTSVLANGKRRIIAYSSKNTPFNLNEGTLLNINLDVPKETANGDYEVELSNIRLVKPDSKEILLDPVTANITVKEVKGDANNDFDVTMGDVVTVANYILERHIGHFWFDAADVNGDGEISIGDLVAIVNIILNPDSYDYNGKMAKRGVMAESGSAISMPDTRSTEGTATVPVSLNNTTAYTAFQMDVELPEGATLASATLCDRAAGHNIAWSKLPDGKMRVVAYSTGNEAINGNAGELIALNIKAEKAVSGAINVDNVRMVTPAGTEYVIGNCGSLLDINGTTGIGTTDGNGLKVYTAGGALIVESGKAMKATVYSTSGKLVKTLEVAEGKNVYEGMPAGTYIVAGVKVAIK